MLDETEPSADSHRDTPASITDPAHRARRWIATGLTLAALGLLILGSRMLPLNVVGQTPASGVDSDGDGLTDLDEQQVYATNPHNPDTDRDGQSDGDEVRAGTDPLSPDSFLHIIGSPTRNPNGSWRVAWASVPGRGYRLQAAVDPVGPWSDVLTIAATAGTTSADDSRPGLRAHGFYRIMLADLSGAPVLSLPVALPNNGWRFRWTSRAGQTYRLESTPALPPTLLSWEAVATVTATGSVAQADDLRSSAGPQNFYRVTQVEGGPDTQRPTVSAVRSTPAPVSAEGTLLLDVNASDDRGLAGVTFFDGSRSLGSATRLDATLWRLLWPVGFDLDGSHPLTARAIDTAGNSATSAVYTLSIAITNRQSGTDIGDLALRGDRVLTNGTQLTLIGNPRLGLVSLDPGATLDVSLALKKSSGSGRISLPGLGSVYQGPFEVDLNSGFLLPSAGFAGPFQPIVFNSRVTLQPRSLRVNIRSGAMDGAGSVRVQVGTNTNSAALLDGDFSYDPSLHQIAIHSTASFAGVSGVGDIVVHLSDATFELSGLVTISGGDHTNYSLTSGHFALSYPSNEVARFSIDGNPTLPALVGLGVRLAGQMDSRGAIALQGNGAGALGGLQFASLRVTLSRAGEPDPVLVGFTGALQVTHLAYGSLSGRIRADGSLAELNSTTELELGNGLRIQPKKDATGRTSPVITLISSAGGLSTFRINGNFLTPEAGGVKPVEVEGPIAFQTSGTELVLKSMVLTNKLPMVDWPLPKSIKLGRASVLLMYTNSEFMARMRGSVVISREGNSDLTFAMDTGLGIDANDPTDVDLDTILTVDGVGVQGNVYFGLGKFELYVGTKPPRATFALLDGNIGLFPKPSFDTNLLSNTGTNSTSGGSTNTSASTTNAPSKIKREDFQLFVEHAAAYISFTEGGFITSLTNGLLRLPPIFTNLPAGLCPNQGSGPILSLRTNSAITIAVNRFADPPLLVRAEGALDFRNIVVLPNIAGFAAELCTAELMFNPGGRPYITNLDGTMSFPFRSETNKIRILKGALSLDGWPSGTVALGTDLHVFATSNGAASLTLLGLGNTNCPQGLSVTAFPAAFGTPPKLKFSGGMDFNFPADIITSVGGDRVHAIACADLTVDPQNLKRPELNIPTLAVGGTFHLGGASGMVLSNALLTLHNPDNFFELSDARTASVAIEGTIIVPKGPAFTLQDAKLTFWDPARPPKFTVRGLGFSEGQFEAVKSVPMRVTAAELVFKSPDAQLPQLFHPTNVIIRFSASMALPSESNPVVKGVIDDMKVSFPLNAPPKLESLHALTLQVGGMKLPPLDAVAGNLHIRDDNAKPATPAPAGLDLPNLPSDPSKLFFAGSVEGSYQGYKLKVLLAFSPSGIGGACLDFNAGNVGIPLDGGALGGILLSGASGGFAFNRGDADPCDFSVWLDSDGKPRDGVIGFPPIKISWEDFTNKVHDMESTAASIKQWLADHHALPAPAASPATAALQSLDGPRLAAALPHTRYTNEFGLPCPGDCPPPTVNILCQPHPDRDRFPHRVIFKFSSIDESTLNYIGFTPEWVQSRFSTGSDWATQMARQLVAGLRQEIVSKIPQPDPEMFGVQAAQELADIINGAIDKMEVEFVKVVVERIATEQNAQAVYNKIRDTAYEGAPCLDISLSVSGTFTYEAVSSFLSGTVGGAITSAGNAGLTGKINLLGVPVGTGKLFVAATDEKGNPNASVCGQVDVSFGPFSLAGMRAAYQCQGCTENFAGIVGSLFECLTDDFVRSIVASVVPRIVIAAKTRSQLAAEMTLAETMAVVQRIFTSSDLPGDLRYCFRQQVQSFIGNINPEMLFCGEVRPRVFGLSLGPSLMSAGMQVNKRGFIGAGSYSPSFLIAMPFLAAAESTGAGTVALAAGPLAVSLFAQDQATYGYALEIPDPAEMLLAGIDGKLKSVNAVSNYVEQGFNTLIQNAAYTFNYTLSPLGFKTLDAQSRLVMPNFLHHPALPGSGWVRPEDRRVTPALPSRLNLLVSALTNHLQGSSLGLIGDPKWKGSSADLGLAFAGTTNQDIVAGLSMLEDYFPHGGVIGGAYLQIPRALYEAPPQEFFDAVDQTKDPITRLSSAASYILDYVLKSHPAGGLGFYVPAPNPPVFTDAQGHLLSPKIMMEGIQNFDPANFRVGQAYPYSQFFMRGYFDGQLLGVPIAQGTLDAALADPAVGTEGLFRVTANVPTGSWLDPFVKGARLIFEMKGAPPAPIESTFSNLLVQVRATQAANPGQAAVVQTLNTVLDQFHHAMPKVKLEADLPITLPAPIDDVLAFTGGTHLYAYSPHYDPGYLPSATGPLARVRREGGIAFQGNANLKIGLTTVAAIQNAELSVIPHDSSAPELNGKFVASRLQLPPFGWNNAAVDFASAPNPHFSASGSMDPIPVGLFTVQPLVGNSVTGKLDVVRLLPGVASAAISISPARIGIPALTTQSFLIHGATRNDSFSISSSSPWNATVEITNTLTLSVAGQSILTLASSGMLSPITFAGNGTTSGSININLGSGTTVSVFPGQSFAQTFQIGGNPTGKLTLRSDGTFELTGVLANNLDWSGLPGLAVAQSGASASFTLTQDGLTVTGGVSGGVLGQVGSSGFSGTATVFLPRNGLPTLTGSGSLSVPRFSFGKFAIEGTTGGNISATLGNNGLSFSGGRLNIEGIITNTLPAFTMNPTGDFGVHLGPVSASLYGFSATGFEAQVGRTNGVWSVKGVQGSFGLPSVGAGTRVTLKGDISSDGGFTWTGSLPAGGTLTVVGAPFTSLAGGAQVQFQRTIVVGIPNVTMSITGNLGGGALAGFPAPSGTTTFTLSSSGQVTVSASVTLQPATLGVFKISGPNGAAITVTLDNSGLTFSSGVEVAVSGIVSSSASVSEIQKLSPTGFVIQPNGSFNVSFTVPSLLVGGFALSSPTLAFRRTGSGAVPPLTVSLGVTGTLTDPGGVIAPLVVNGSVASTGAVLLSANGQSGSISGYPFVGINATLSKTAGANGSLALDAQINLPPIFSSRLSGSANGSAAGTALTLHYGGGLTLGTFNLGGASLDLSAPAGQPKVLSLTGSLDVARFQALSFAGVISTGGQFSLTNTLGSGGTLASFPVGSMVNVLRRGTLNYPNVVAGDSPLAYWRLEETSGTTALCATDPGFNGIYDGKTLPTLGQPGGISGISSRSVRFSGSQFVSVKDQTGFGKIKNAMAAEAWIKVNAFDATWQTILSKGDSSWRVQRNANDNTIAFDTDGLNPPYLAGSRNVNDGLWHHVVATYDGHAKYIYVDGKLDASTQASGSIQGNGYDLMIGENAQTGSRGWNGWIDEVALYARALTPAEIQEHYQGGGGIALTSNLRLTMAGLDLADLQGTLSDMGAFDFVARPASANFGGFPVQNAYIHLARSATGPGAIDAEGSWSIPTLSGGRLSGRIQEGGALDLSASLPALQIMGFGFTDGLFQLTGNVYGGASLSAGATLPLPALSLDSVRFNGGVSPNGEFSLSAAPSWASLSGFPISPGTIASAFQHTYQSYSTVIAGPPIGTKDFGDQPLAYWRLGEATGPTVVDSKKRTRAGDLGFPGTYNGGVRLGQPGGITGPDNTDTSARFDGASGSVTIGGESAFDFQTSMAVEAWVKVAAWDRTWQAIVTKGDTSWRLTRFGNSSQASFETTSAAGPHSLPGQTALDDGQWHHLVGVYDGLAKYLYVDGMLEAFAPYSDPLNQNDWPVMIGENAEASGRLFNGWIDEAAVYAHALAPSQVLDHYRAGGGARLSTSFNLALPNGFATLDVAGILDPKGSFCVTANPVSYGLPFLSLDNAQVALARVAGGAAGLQVKGNVNTTVGTLGFSGALLSNGDYSLYTTAGTGSLPLAGNNFNFNSGLKLTPSLLSGVGSVAYGSFNFGGSFSFPKGGNASFSGSTSGNTDWIHFGVSGFVTKDGIQFSPDRPDARVSWNADATFDGGNSSFSTKASASLDVLDKFGVQFSFGFNDLGFSSDGRMSLTLPGGRTFVDPWGNKIGSFCFDLINRTKCP